jgi:hypothetical protein
VGNIHEVLKCCAKGPDVPASVKFLCSAKGETYCSVTLNMYEIYGTKAVTREKSASLKIRIVGNVGQKEGQATRIWVGFRGN